MANIFHAQYMRACDTTDWPREVSADRGEPGRPIIELPWNPSVQASDQSGAPMRCQRGQRSWDKMFDFHPSFQTVTLDPRAGPAVTHPSANTSTPHCGPARDWDALKRDFLRTRQPVTPAEWRGSGLRGRRTADSVYIHTYRYILCACVCGIINHSTRVRTFASSEARGPWQRWQGVCREWWDPLLTRTTRGEDTRWKVGATVGA